LVQALWSQLQEHFLTRDAATVIFRGNGRSNGEAMGRAARQCVNGTENFEMGRDLRSEGSSTQAIAPSGQLLRYYEAMSSALGPKRWWPARTPFEVIVGAILTQSTSWGNVELAIANLRSARILTPAALLRVPTSRLARFVRPSGYFRQKARKLKAFVRFLYAGYGGSLKKMFRTPTPELREKLLSVHGIGPETADSILLYAGNHPVFVVDAYTHRIFGRHGITDGKPDYETVRAMIETSLPPQAELFNEFHALIVNTGKNWCRKNAPRCEECPLRSMLPSNSPLSIITARVPGVSLSGSGG
jgi:endonuclease-3 related protein